MFQEKTREFQKGFDSEACRRVREDDRLKLRKEDRESRLQAKRRTFNDRTSNNQQNTSNNQPKQVQEMISQLQQYVQGCYTDQIATQYECCQRIRRLLSIENNPPICEVIQSGIVPRLVQFLQDHQHDKLQFEAAWALTNIASGTAEDTAHVIRNGALPIFVQLLKSKNMDVCEQAAWALGNMAGDSPECRNLVLQYQALENIIPICYPREIQSPQHVSLIRNATWTLSNLVRGKPSPPLPYVKLAIQTLANLVINMKDKDILIDACWGFCYISDSENIAHNDPNAEQKLLNEKTKIQWIENSGALKKLIELLGHPNDQIKHPALRTIGNIVSGPDDLAEMVINLGVLPKLLSLLENKYDTIRRESCWTISNITAGPVQHIDAVIQANIIPMLIRMLKQEKFDIQKESAWALSNITSSEDEQQIKYLVNQGIISPFCKLLHCNSTKTILVVLEGLENILQIGKKDLDRNIPNKYFQWVEECKGLDYLEELQSNDKTPLSVCEKAASIVRTYFECDDDNNEGEESTQTHENKNNRNQTNSNNINRNQINNNNNNNNNTNNNINNTNNNSNNTNTNNTNNANSNNSNNTNNKNGEEYFAWNVNNDQNNSTWFNF